MWKCSWRIELYLYQKLFHIHTVSLKNLTACLNISIGKKWRQIKNDMFTKWYSFTTMKLFSWKFELNSRFNGTLFLSHVIYIISYFSFLTQVGNISPLYRPGTFQAGTLEIELGVAWWWSSTLTWARASWQDQKATRQADSVAHKFSWLELIQHSRS